MPYTKIISKWINDLNVRPETITVLDKNIGREIFDINHSKIFFFNYLLGNKNKNKQMELKLRDFCTAKKTIIKMKRQPSK